MNIAHTLHHSDVAVGDKGDGCWRLGVGGITFHPVIVVLHNHQLVATTQFVFAIQHRVSDTLIVDVSALVTTGNHHRLVHPHSTIAGGQRFYQLIAWHTHNISKALESDFGQNPIVNQRSDTGSIPKNTRIL